MTSKLTGLIVLLLLAGTVFSACGPSLHEKQEAAYNETRQQIYDAVQAFSVDHAGLSPSWKEIEEVGISMKLPPGYINLSPLTYKFGVFDICELIWPDNVEDDYLPKVPEGCYGQMNESGTNFYDYDWPCGTDKRCTNPSPGHYIWIIDPIRYELFSVCVGNDCWANDEDGYQGVWP